MSTIFIQLASYRDSELPCTIASALGHARDPGRLRFGVCWQHDESERQAMGPYLDREHFRVDRVRWQASQGCCWARYRTNRLYGGETYMLQVDSHSRFLPWWDEILIDMLESTGRDKPLLSSYPPSYASSSGGEKLHVSNGVQRLALRRINRDLTLTMRAENVPDLTGPGESHFIAAGLLFTLGRFVTDIPYDPALYFNGEEINLAVRAYTHGYDFFYPHRNLIYHLYGHGADKHWTDHPQTSVELRQQALGRLRELLIGDPSRLAPYGIGTARTVADYEEYAGLDFQARAREVADPNSVVVFQKEIELPLDEVPDSDDYECIIFCLFDGSEEIYREDIYDPEILSKRQRLLRVSTELDVEPDRFMLWPKTRQHGFGERMMFDL